MSDFKNAKEDLLFFAKRFKGILAILPDLEKISSLEDYISEKTKTLKNIGEEEAKAVDEINELKELLADLREQRETMLSNTKDEIDRWREQYMIWEKSARHQFKKDLDDKATAFKNKQAKLLQEIKETEDKLAELKAETYNSVRKYEDIKRAIEDLRTRL